MALTVRDGAVVSLFEVAIVRERVGDAGMRWLDQSILDRIIEVLEDSVSQYSASLSLGIYYTYRPCDDLPRLSRPCPRKTRVQLRHDSL